MQGLGYSSTKILTFLKRKRHPSEGGGDGLRGGQWITETFFIKALHREPQLSCDGFPILLEENMEKNLLCFIFGEMGFSFINWFSDTEWALTLRRVEFGLC